MRELQPSAVKWNRMLAILCCVAAGLWLAGTVLRVVGYESDFGEWLYEAFFWNPDILLEIASIFIFACYLVGNICVNKWPLLAVLAIGFWVLSSEGINLYMMIIGLILYGQSFSGYDMVYILCFALGILAVISVLCGMTKFRWFAVAWMAYQLWIQVRVFIWNIADLLYYVEKYPLSGIDRICSYIEPILFCLVLLLFFVRNRIPALIKPAAKAKKKSLPPEKALRALKGDYEFGLFSAEEYAAARQEILAKL